jgi:hypothetical protein
MAKWLNSRVQAYDHARKAFILFRSQAFLFHVHAQPHLKDILVNALSTLNLVITAYR